MTDKSNCVVYVTPSSIFVKKSAPGGAYRTERSGGSPHGDLSRTRFLALGFLLECIGIA